MYFIEKIANFEILTSDKFHGTLMLNFDTLKYFSFRKPYEFPPIFELTEYTQKFGRLRIFGLDLVVLHDFYCQQVRSNLEFSTFCWSCDHRI